MMASRFTSSEGATATPRAVMRASANGKCGLQVL